MKPLQVCPRDAPESMATTTLLLVTANTGSLFEMVWSSFTLDLSHVVQPDPLIASELDAISKASLMKLRNALAHMPVENRVCWGAVCGDTLAGGGREAL